MPACRCKLMKCK